MKVALLIPIYEPNDMVVPFLSTFKGNEFDFFLVVNDGSNKEKFDSIYQEIEEKTPFKVIGYEVNNGKGYALKYGIQYLQDNIQDLDYIVTADGDGQHTYNDILRVKDRAFEKSPALVLGARDLYGPNVPRNSRVGNKFSQKYFKIHTGKKLKDTQTGLRAIPKELFYLALTTNGNRYDYEMIFLSDAVRAHPYEEVDIETIYENNENATTHFRPFVDSVIVYKTPLLYILVSLLSFAIDISLFHVFSSFVFTINNIAGIEANALIFFSTASARIISGIFNFLMFHYVVFNSKDDIGKKALKYWLLWAVNLGLSWGLTALFKYLPAHLTFIKFIVDTVIAVMNFIINLTFIFVRKKIKK